MFPSIASVGSRRSALRRAVRMECQVLSALWDEIAPLMATNLSPYGLWLDSGLALDEGDEVVVSFRPPGWPDHGWPVTVMAEVVRVQLSRRQADSGPAGMGLRFIDLDPQEGARMSGLLRGLPPPLPPPRAAAEAVLQVDGFELEWRAEGPLLHAVRAPKAPLATATRPPRASAAPIAQRLRVRAHAVRRRFRPRLPLPAPAPAVAATPRKARLRLVG
jgi:PilZ domain